MYFDGVVLFGVLVLVLTCAVVVYLGYYSWKHFKQDEQKSVKDTARQQGQAR